MAATGLHSTPPHHRCGGDRNEEKDKEDIESGLGLAKGGQISPGAVERSKTIIKHKLAEKGYEKASVNIELKEDPTTPNYVTVYIDIDRKKQD